MTQYPEAYLCRELGMAVVNISLITDYDAGVLEGTHAVTAHDVLAVFEQNAERIRKVVLDMVGRFPADLDALGAGEALRHTRGDGHVAGPADIRLFETLEPRGAMTSAPTPVACRPGADARLRALRRADPAPRVDVRALQSARPEGARRVAGARHGVPGDRHRGRDHGGRRAA